MPTLHVGHFDNLKLELYEGGPIRVWLSRMTVDDGSPCNNQVTVEKFNNKTKRWETIDEYEAV